MNSLNQLARFSRPNLQQLLAAFTTALVAALAVLLFGERSVEIRVVSPAVGPSAPTPQDLGERSQVVYSHVRDATESDLRQPVGELVANDRRFVPPAVTLAAPEQSGCSTRLVRNYSSRNGRTPLLWVLHYTVSPNRPGLSDMDAVAAWFNNPRSQASSHYLIDNEGHCYLLVPESQKAWTQATFNPVSISVEVINTGREPSYAGRAGLRKLARVISDSAARWRIPIRKGAVRGCTVVRSGIIDHDALGQCGGGHTDIRPYSVDTVIAAGRGYRAEVAAKRRYRPLTAREAREARLRCYHRRKHLAARKGSAEWRKQVRYARYRKSRIRVLMREIEFAASKTGWQKRDRKERYELLGRYLSGKACR